MLRKKSSPWMRTKGLYIIPVAVIALSAFATPELNNKVDNIIEPQKTSVGKVNQNPSDHQIISEENSNPVVSGILEGILGGLMESDNEGSDETGTDADTIKVERMVAKNGDIVTLISNGEDMTPKLLYFFDGIEVSYATICKMNVDNIAGVHILNAEQGTKAYGEKGQYGVVYITTKNAETVKDDEVLEICEKLPEYPGGMQELMTYLSQAVRYPVVAMEQGLQGRAIVNFIVEKDGSISNVKSQNFHAINNVKQVDGEASDYEKKSSEDDATADNDDYVKAYQASQALIQEAERVVKSMPNWTPGMQDGNPVRVRYTIPITFRLQ